MFDPVYVPIVNTLRANPKIIFDGQYDIEGGQTFRVNFTAKMPAPGNQADIDLSEVFESFPDGIAVQRIADITHTKIRLPVGGERSRPIEEVRGDFLLTVTKANWLRGNLGKIDVSVTIEPSIQDVVTQFNNLSEQGQSQFLSAARLLLKGLSI